jgi:ectoine hydroxylase-related dioxygenase (phytanoyl-CoA dioxygenase family)
MNRDLHATMKDQLAMIGCVTALTKTTKENGATILVPGSHKWPADRPAYDEEAVPAELEPGDAVIFLGNLYHAGGANITTYVTSLVDALECEKLMTFQ